MSIVTRYLPAAVARRLGQLRRNEDGTTAVELGLIVFPFTMMLFGILAVCMYFFSVFTSEQAVWSASRDMRTGVYQNASTAAYQNAGQPKTGDDLKAAFKQQICSRVQSFIDCTNDVRVLVQARSQFDSTGIVAPSCTDGTGAMVSDANAMSNFNAGDASTVVIVTACVRWRLASQMPFLKFGNMSDGSRLIQASASFRTEPWK